MTKNFTPHCSLLSAFNETIKKKLPLIVAVFCTCFTVVPLLANTSGKMPADASYVSSGNRIVTPVNNPKEDPLVTRLVQGALKHNPYKENASLGDVLNPDGTIKNGAEGSFNTRGFHLAQTADGAPRFIPDQSNLNCTTQWDTRFSTTGASGNVNAVAVAGGKVYIGGLFTNAGNQAASNLAVWDGTSWSGLGTFDASVSALAVSGNNLYVGGAFTIVSGISAASHIAFYNMQTGTWNAMGSGITGTAVSALAVDTNGNVYAGGFFSSAGGTTVNDIAKWNGSTWSALGSGMNNSVSAIAVSGSKVYAGGNFTTAGGSTANRIAVWDTTLSSWSAMGTGVTAGVINAIAIVGSNVYIGGSFTSVNGVANSHIAAWNSTNSSWNTPPANMITSGTINTLAANGTDLYVGGSLTSVGPTGSVITVNRIAIWHTTSSTWSALGTTGASATVTAIAFDGSNVYVGGQFTLVNTNIAANRIAVWNGSSWAPLDAVSASYGNAVNSNVYAIAISGNNMYIGGIFTLAGTTTVSRIALWNGSTWSNMGGGVTGGAGEVDAITVSGSNVYVGGQFTTAGGVAANGIALWNGSTWSAVGGGVTNSTAGLNAVYTIVVNGSNVYIGGSFDTAGSVTVSDIAMWNGSTWSNMGGGALGSGGLSGGIIRAMVMNGSNLYVGGFFTTVAGTSITANHIAVWNGSAWSALGTGTNNGVNAQVYSIAINGTKVYIGGSFTTAGTISAGTVAYWDGSNWNALGSGISGSSVRSLFFYGSNLYAAGSFSTVNGSSTAASDLAVWNGITWAAVGSGLDNVGYAFATDGTRLYIGGAYATANGNAAIGRFTSFTPASPCWTGATSTAWETASNWNNSTAPQTGGDALIPATGVTNEPTLNSSVALVNLTVQSGRTVTLSGSNTLGVSGTLENAATVTGTGVLVLNGTSAQTIADSTGTINNLTLNNAAGATISSGNNNFTITGTYTPTAGTLTTNSNLILASTTTATARVATGSNSGGYISGAVTVQRYLKTNTGGYGSRRWWFLSAPIAASSNLTISNSWQQTIHITGNGTGGTGSACSDGSTGSQPGVYSNGFDITGGNTPGIYNYNDNNATSSKWTVLSGTNGTNYLVAGAGYRVLVRGDRNVQGCALLIANPPAPSSDVTLSATGNLQQGSRVLTMVKTTANGFNFIGNPYPSEISFTAFQASNSTLTNSYWTYYPDNAAGTYSVYSAGTVTNVPASYNTNPAIIAPGQAFFIQNNTSTGSVTFNESHKSGSTQYGLFGANDNNLPSWDARLRIGLLTNDSAATRIDEAVIRFGTQVSSQNEYNSNWDALSLNEGSQYIQTLKDSNRLAIQTRNQWYTNDTVLLNVKSGTASLKLNFTEFAGMPNQEIYLVDKYTHTTQKITGNPVYNFAVTATDSASYGNGRFMVVFGAAKTVADAVTGVMIYPNPVTSVITVRSKAMINTVRLIDALGRVSLTKSQVNSTQTTMQVSPLATGVYFVEVTDTEGHITVQKVVKQ